MEQPEPQSPEPEEIPEPENIQAIREILASIQDDTDAGSLESISVYGQTRDGGYKVWQSSCPDRHQDAGRMLEFIALRLGFLQREQVDSIIESDGA